MFRFCFEIFEDNIVNSLIWLDSWVPYSISQRYHHEEKLLLVCSRSNKTTSTERIFVVRRFTVPNAAMPPEVGPNHHQHQRRILDGTDTTLSDSQTTFFPWSSTRPREGHLTYAATPAPLPVGGEGWRDLHPALHCAQGEPI